MRLEEFWGIGPKTAALLRESIGEPDAIAAIENADIRTLAAAGVPRGRAVRILRRASGTDGIEVLGTGDTRDVYDELLSVASEYALTNHAADRIRVMTPLSTREAMADRLDRVLAAKAAWIDLGEDDRERDIYTLIGPPIGTDWEALFEAGYVAEPEIELRYLPWDSETARNEYVAAEGHDRRRLAATNPAKVPQVQALVEATSPAKTLVFVDYLEQGQAIADTLGVPFLSGETPHARRERHLGAFRSGQLETLVVSRVGDEGIDLPEAEVAIIASGLGGSRRQGAQRAGRTMRPAGKAQVYVLATKGTDEEEFARRRTRFLAGKGVRISERALEAPDEV